LVEVTYGFGFTMKKESCIVEYLDFLLDFAVLFLLLCLQNTLLNTNFDVLKYIKKIFKIPTSVYFEDTLEDNTKKSSKESELHC